MIAPRKFERSTDLRNCGRILNRTSCGSVNAASVGDMEVRLRGLNITKGGCEALASFGRHRSVDGQIQKFRHNCEQILRRCNVWMVGRRFDNRKSGASSCGVEAIGTKDRRETLRCFSKHGENPKSVKLRFVAQKLKPWRE